MEQIVIEDSVYVVVQVMLGERWFLTVRLYHREDTIRIDNLYPGCNTNIQQAKDFTSARHGRTQEDIENEEMIKAHILDGEKRSTH